MASINNTTGDEREELWGILYLACIVCNNVVTFKAEDASASKILRPRKTKFVPTTCRPVRIEESSSA